MINGNLHKKYSESKINNDTINRNSRNKNISYNIIKNNYANYVSNYKHISPKTNLYDPFFKERPKSEIFNNQKNLLASSSLNKLNGTQKYNNKNKINKDYFNNKIEPLKINNNKNELRNSMSQGLRIRNNKPIQDKKITVELKKDNGTYNPSSKCVKEYSYKEDQNIEYRVNMEDYCKIIDKFMNDNNKGLFCLFDGHGGSEPVKYVKDRISELISKFLIETNNNVEKSLIFSFQKIDDELKLLSQSENVGTTACIAYFFKENDPIIGFKRILYSANVGDTRMILITDKMAKRLSYDHKSSDENEAYRIKKAGGVVFNGRVFGQLALSRALGDHGMKKYGVSNLPHIYKHFITDVDRYVIIASDGVWDVLTEQEVYNLSLKCKNSDELSSTIINNAIKNGSRDNISCITIKVN